MLERIDIESFWLDGPASADELVGREALERFGPLGEVARGDEVIQVGSVGPTGAAQQLFRFARSSPTPCARPSLTRSNRRSTDPYARWCGRGGAARHPPIPIVTSTPAVCGAMVRRCRCRRAAGCRPRLLAIPPFKCKRPAVTTFPDNVVGSACTSTFSRLAQRSLALRPAHSTRGHLYVTSYTEGFSHFVTSMTAPVASGWSGRRVGLAPTGKRRLVTAHT